MGEGPGGTQQVTHTVKIMLVLFDGFNAHPLSGQQSLVAWGIARWGHEFEVSVTTTKEEASSEVTETESIFYPFYKVIFIYYNRPL